MRESSTRYGTGSREKAHGMGHRAHAPCLLHPIQSRADGAGRVIFWRCAAKRGAFTSPGATIISCTLMKRTSSEILCRSRNSLFRRRDQPDPPATMRGLFFKGTASTRLLLV
jgi:hypothetical protein